MSMTNEEAIALLNEQYETCKRIYDCSADQRKSYPNVPQFMEALGMALSALRPFSREQVEKVWKGEWTEETYTTQSERGRVIHSTKNTCSACGKTNGRTKTNFCPSCGAPMTDEAVEMVMERMEALYGQENT